VADAATVALAAGRNDIRWLLSVGVAWQHTLWPFCDDEAPDGVVVLLSEKEAGSETLKTEPH
jgi:hypothetical protein